MFKLAENRQVLWPVTIEAPADDGTGAVNRHPVKVRYTLLTLSQIREVQELSRNPPANDPDAAVRREDDLLMGHVVGWEDILTADGAPLPWDAYELARLLEVPYVRRALAEGLYEASRGAPAKNSAPGSAGPSEPTAPQ